MNHRMSAPVLTALVLVLGAGAASSVMAQTANDPSRDAARNRDPNRDITRPQDAATGADAQRDRQAGADTAAMDFRSCHWLSERRVVNHQGEDVGSISDLILERGSGRIAYAVLTTGAAVSMAGHETAGRQIAVPYSSLRWDRADTDRLLGDKDRFVMAANAEEIKRFPEYTPERWQAMKDSAGDEQNPLRRALGADTSASASDPYTGRLDNATRTRIEGEVTGVERIRSGAAGEQVIITLKTADGSSKKVTLGPSWYINGSAAAPMRGERVAVDTVSLPSDPEHALAATDVRSGDREFNLRGSDGRPVWGGNSIESSGQSYSMPYSRYLLLSELRGMQIDCRNNECGKVNDIILDRNSGQIAFLSIDPNQNFLGIGDTKRLIPWSIATVTLDRNVRIDASKEMLLASPETPTDVTTLNTGDRRGGVYKAFNVEEQRFESTGDYSSATPEDRNAWSARGPILSGIESGSHRTIQGKVVDVSDMKCEGGTHSARALKVKTSDGAGTEELVLVGPTWYGQSEQSAYRAGDDVKLDACRTTIDGRQYWIARSIECKDKRVVLLDANNSPAWARP